jgi:hypothetical protein
MKITEVDYVLKATEMPAKIRELVREPWTAVDPARAKDILREFPRPEGEKMSERYDEGQSEALDVHMSGLQRNTLGS